MRRQTRTTVRRVGLLAVGAALAGGLVAVGAKRTGRTPEGGMAGLARRRASGLRNRRPAEDQTYTCTCGTSYRVVGTDRHRVYWTMGASDDAPVLGDRCTSCDAPLPAGRETSVTSA
jgi:hypothetical protein